MSGTYVDIKYSNPKILRKFFTQILPDSVEIIPEDDFHTTLMYAENAEISDVGSPLVGSLIVFHNPLLELFDSDDGKCLVFSFWNELIIREHDRIKRTYGLKHSYDPFRPHITLEYNTSIKDPSRFSVTGVPVVEVKSESTSKLDTEWSYDR